MSYILEALQKSDRERQRGNVPDLSAEHDTVLVQPEPKSRWPLIFLLTIIACTALISYVFWPSHRVSSVNSLPTHVVPQATSVIQENVVAEPISENVRESNPLPVSTLPVVTKVDPVNPTPSEVMPVRRVALSKPTAVAPRNFPNESSEPRRRTTENRSAVPRQAEVVTPDGSGQYEDDVSFDDVGVSDSREVDSRADDLALLARARRQLQQQANAESRRTSSEYLGTENYHLSYPDIDELDPVVQNLIPDLEFTTHIYSTENDKSFVMVNGKLLVEGENINSSLALLKILPGHVVMDFEGSQFRVESLKTWRK